jgi:ferredoxin
MIKPLNILIATFSQTGTTLKVAERITEALHSFGHKTIFHKIGDNPLPDINDFDVIGIGTPVYIFRPPFIVSDFVNNLPDLQGKKFFTFVQFGTIPGDCGNRLRKALLKKHGMDMGYHLTRGADYFIGYIRRETLFSPSSPDETDLQCAHDFGKILGQRLERNLPVMDKYDPQVNLIYASERFSTNRLFTKYMYSRFFRTNKNCNACGICVKKCPVGNISLNGSKRPSWQNKCILCGTCELLCPEEAITSPFDWPIFSPFMNYNVRHGKKMDFPYAKVRLQKGKTMVIP